ncbi:MAG TPA: YggT family protein [Dehalococcoidia bacterium]|nr:YggT family protein [Dehalococcoidia bacterium]
MSDPANLVNLLFWFFYIAILARIILSFLVPMAGPRPNPLLANLYAVANQITEPILGPIRRVLPNLGFLDLSPMVAIILLEIIRYVIIEVLLGGG